MILADDNKRKFNMEGNRNMISIVIKSDRNADWSFYQDKSMTAIVKRNRVIVALENPGRELSDHEASKMLSKEIHRYGESMRKPGKSYDSYNKYDKKRKYNKYDSRRKTKYGW